jgi:Ca2+-binding EF-hand superfamily protein
MLMRSAAILVAASLMVTGPAWAQPSPQTGPAKPRAGQYFERADTNKDGFIDRAEFRAVGEKLFERLDKNKDGRLTEDELKGRRGGDAAKRLARLDSNKDGGVSREEFLAAGEQRFARCDKNGDGKLARGECGGRQANRTAPATRQ